MTRTHMVNFLPGAPIRVTIGADTYRDDNHWTRLEYPVTITYRGRTMRVRYSQGMEHKRNAVDPLDVLSSIAFDGVAAEQGLESFLNDYGYAENREEGRRVYAACDANWDRIRRVFARNAREFYDWANGLDR